ncbi:Transcription elongation factor A protein 1 [Bonamia ostreae]|uniref:Transcription elongation factor A protein 1 n=1 Tax=Bonamia ostreae TaxID=126728 RepID=A0ABV2AH14_9EUKA
MADKSGIVKEKLISKILKSQNKSVVQKDSKNDINDKKNIKNINEKVRSVVREKISQALIAGLEMDVDKKDLEEIGSNIEAAMLAKFGNTGNNYKSKYRSLIANMRDKKNPEFNKNIATKKISAYKVVEISEYEMASSKLKEERKKEKEIAIKDSRSDIISQSTASTTSMFQCAKCKERKASYYQLQTRSADEPMTTFVTCINCNNRWKC